ncbi:MAG TPA: carboxypeptidase regulatory-like domain-containing protein [Solirubrobacteraceae bacterium]|nr:carboxypeptidase regulatory-like domain-containing protein [Solirubrobacteraceae bacterium]
MQSEAGFTLIEAMVTALIVTLIAAGVAQALMTGADFSANQRLRSQADAIAQQDQERLKGLSDEQLATLAQTRTVTLDGTNFTIASNASFLDASGGSSCTSKVAAYFHVVTTVSWGQTDTAQHSITQGTILTRPAAGSLLVNVDDEQGNPLQGAKVTATGQTTGSAQSAITDANGCVVFSGLPGLPVQSYGVAALLGGYVDKDGNNSPPNVTAAVNATGIATPNINPLVIGNAGMITAGFTTTRTGGVSVPNISAPELSYYGSLSDHMTTFKTVTTAGAAISTPKKLFPFVNAGPIYTNNYQVWAGGCSQEQPAQPPASTGFATVTPGSSVAATVAMPAIDLALYYNSALKTPSDVKIKFVATTGPNCSNSSLTETWTGLTAVASETVGSYTYGVYPGPFASTAAAGQPNASLNGDKATVQICADYNTGGSSYRKEWSSSMTNTSFTGPSAYVKMDVGTDGGAASGQC